MQMLDNARSEFSTKNCENHEKGLQIHVKKQLGKLQLCADLAIPARGVTALFGLSGSGKTSLIELISGLTRPDLGKITLNGRVLVDTMQGVFVPPNKRHIGFVFQDARLFPHYRVLGNLTYGMKNATSHEAHRNIAEIVELLGIGDLLKRYPLTLSGGEKQRVAIGRALLTAPEILLMDEPLSALDLPRKRELLDYLDTLSARIQIPIIYVTHSLDELMRLADNVALLHNGKVAAYDKLEKVWHSPTFAPWVMAEQGDMGRTNVLALPVACQRKDFQTTGLAMGDQTLWIRAIEPPQDRLVRLCIHSSDISIALQKPVQSSIRNSLQGCITQIQPKSEGVDVAIAIGEHTLYATISHWANHALNLHTGQTVYAQIKMVSVLR